MKAYFLSVICSAILCGILTGLLEKKETPGKILRLICGVFLSFTVIRPITDVKLDSLSLINDAWISEGEAASATGADSSAQAIRAIIKQETGAYILDKAISLDGERAAEVILDEACIPCGVVLEGKISSQGKQKLEQLIAEDLGIPKEEQIWNVS